MAPQTGQAENAKGGAEKSRWSLAVCGLLMLAVLLARLFTLQVVLGSSHQAYSEKNWLRPKQIPGQRGRILDRNQHVLADVVPSFVVMFDAQNKVYLQDRDAVAQTLDRVGMLTGEDPDVLTQRVDRARTYSYQPIPLIRNADTLMVAIVEENRASLPGVFVDVVPMRHYPQDSLAAHVLGYVQEVSAKDIERLGEGIYRPGSMIGRTGIESQYEPVLRGRDGVQFIEVSAVGRRTEAFTRMDPIPAKSGRDIVLSLDRDLQACVERALSDAPYDGKGRPPAEVSGSVAVIDVRTGDVLALASAPRFDPNQFPRGFTHEMWNELMRPEQPLFHRAVQGRYPPGSTFKGVTLYAGLERGLVTSQTRLEACVGGWQYGERFFRCWRPGGHMRVDAVEAMAHSCDVYFYQLGADMGVTGIHAYSERFGILGKTGIDLPGEPDNMVPDPAWYDEHYGVRRWTRGVALNLSIGQGEIQMTPLELAVFAGGLATGNVVQPRLLLREEGQAPETVNVSSLNLEPQFLRVVQRGMRAAVEWGTAQIVNFPELAVAAKTGTAENRGEDHAVFVAYAPYENPEIALAVYLENRGHGGAAAGPVAREILAHYFGIEDAGAGVIVESD